MYFAMKGVVILQIDGEEIILLSVLPNRPEALHLRSHHFPP